MEFRKTVREKKVKWPTQQGFTLQKWDSAWNSSRSEDPNEIEIWKAGRIFFSIFEDIRREFKKLYEERPGGLKDLLLLKYYCAISNRDAAILYKAKPSEAGLGLNLFSLSYSKNKYGNELTLQEISEACVDGYQKAISFCVKRIHVSEEQVICKSDAENTVLSFIDKESTLSQLYGLYEELWRSLIWGDYSFTEIDKIHRIYEISQRKSDDEVAKIVSYTRKMRIASTPVSEALLDILRKVKNSDKFIYPEKANKKRVLKVGSFSSKNPLLGNISLKFQSSVAGVFSSLPKNFLLEEHGACRFTLHDALEVQRQIVLLSHGILNRLPDDNGFTNPEKLGQFCPSFRREDLIRSISVALAISYEKVAEIISFLTYDGKWDIWSHPIIDLGDGMLGLILGASTYPVPLRLVENWLGKLEVDLDEKGVFFEQAVIEELNQAIDSNQLINNYGKAVSKKLVRGGSEEQIDLVMRVGRIVLLGECKSIVTTDSATSYFSAMKAIRKGASQAKRKADFFNSDIADSFQKLGWEYDSNENYEVVPVVINSNRVHVGFPVNGVPVCDEMILCKYFTSDCIPLFSIPRDGEMSHLAWFRIYSDFDSLQNNFYKYLMRPPQISDGAEDLIHKSIKLPFLNDISPKVIVKNLVAKNVPIADRLARETAFPLEHVPDLEQEMDAVDFYI